MRVELIHERDAEDSCGFKVFINGEPIDDAEVYDIDPGAGHSADDPYQFKEYAEGMAGWVAEASPTVAEVLAACAIEALQSPYVEGTPTDPRVIERYFALWVRAWRDNRN